VNPISRLGAAILRSVEEVGRYVKFSTRAGFAGLRPPFRLRHLFKQMHFVGIQSLLIILITGAFTGMVFTVQSDYAFSKFGARALIGSTVMLALTRELAPVLTALMVNGRVGSAMAAELGTMRVTEQIDALDAIAVDPYQYLVAPRVLAGVLMVPCLTIMFDAIGLAGSWSVATIMLKVNPGSLMSRIEWYVDPEDIVSGMVKAAVFGGILTAVGCYKGFTTTGGAEGVGIATTRAVVISSVLILVSDYFITLALLPYMNG
jgi:phospholipid/cholesterol/gamma-HCH transport system permease protein